MAAATPAIPSPDEAKYYEAPTTHQRHFSEFVEFGTYTTTTAKLPGELQSIAVHNSFVEEGEVMPPAPHIYPSYEYILQVTHLGGRDWVILTGLERATPKPLEQDVPV